MNQVICVGNLTDEPIIDVYNEHKKATFTLALNRIKEGADFPRFIAWDKRADVIEKYCHKGMKLAVRGHIQTGSYEKDGKKIYTTDFIVDDFEFCEKKTDGQPKENPSDSFVQIPEGIEEEMPFA